MNHITALAARLGERAAGSWQEEAAVWLLASHGHWIPELERTRLIHNDGEGQHRIAWRLVASACLSAGDGPLIGTLPEWQVLRLACVLTGRHALSMANISLLDEPDKRLALHAMAWASGGRAWAASLALLPPEHDTQGPSARVWCEVHPGLHIATAECRNAHYAGPTGPEPQAHRVTG